MLLWELQALAVVIWVGVGAIIVMPFFVYRKLKRAGLTPEIMKEEFRTEARTLFDEYIPRLKDEIGNVEERVSKTFDTKVEDLFTKLKDPDSKELYALSAMLLWRFLAVMEEPDIKKVIHAKIIGYTKAYGPQFFEAIKGEAAKQYPILEQIPQGVGPEDPSAWVKMIPEEFRGMVEGFMPIIQLMKMGKK
jgi:hypothetical protein